MSRSQYCREHIDKVAQMCGLEKSTVSDVKQAAAFCDEHSEFSDCSTHAIMTLIRVKDEQVRGLAISLVENALNASTPTGGKVKKSLTEPEIRKIISQAEEELGKSVAPKPKKTPPKEKPIRCMYLSRDETGCHAPAEYQEKCTEEIRQNRNCPIPIVVPQPRTLAEKMHDTSEVSDTGEQHSISGEQNNTQQVPRTASVLQPPNPDIQKYEITARRYAQVALRQYVHHKFAEDEQQAAQMAFDKGIETILDEVENRCMTEGEGEGED